MVIFQLLVDKVQYMNRQYFQEEKKLTLHFDLGYFRFVKSCCIIVSMDVFYLASKKASWQPDDQQALSPFRGT